MSGDLVCRQDWAKQLALGYVDIRSRAVRGENSLDLTFYVNTGLS